MRIALPSLLVLGTVASSAHAGPNQAALTAGVARLPAPRAVMLAATPVIEHDLARGADLGLTGARGGRRAAFLDPDTITAAVAPLGPDIERCFVDGARRAGHLDLTLLIARDGGLVSLRASATGLAAPAARRVEACIGAVAASLKFPARRNDTTAVVPYYFQRTAAPNAGPQLSCWSARGC